MGIFVHGKWLQGGERPDWLPEQWNVETDANGFTRAIDTSGNRYYLTALKLAIHMTGEGTASQKYYVAF